MKLQDAPFGQLLMWAGSPQYIFMKLIPSPNLEAAVNQYFKTHNQTPRGVVLCMNTASVCLKDFNGEGWEIANQ